MSLSPSEVTLAPGESVEFTATVLGAADNGVTWTSTGGRVVPSGMTAVFTAPVEVGEYEVRATSAGDRGRWASAMVTVAGDAVGGSYPYGDAVALGDELVELEFDGGRVLVPAVREGSASSVAVSVVADPIGVVTPMTGLTKVVALRFSGDLDLVGATEEQAPALQLVLEPSDAAAADVSASDFEAVPVMALAWVRVDEGPWVPLGGTARWDGGAGEFLVSVAHPLEACKADAELDTPVAACEFAWQVVDAAPLVAAEDAIDVEVDASGLVSSASTMRAASGMYQVNLDAFAAAGSSCELDRLDGFLTHENDRASWTRSARTALVFVHGWQSLAGLMQGLDGDEPLGLPAHCSNWESFFSGLASAEGPWASLRANADVFTFRYNSNQRVTDNGFILAGWLPQMQMLGYERVVLVAHSMGGMVVHDARARVFLDGTSGLNPVDLPVVTLATPYMGGPLVCTEVAAGFCQAADSSLLTSIWGLVPVSGMWSTLDLSTALNVTTAQRLWMGHQDWLGFPLPYERNPYLLGLWENVNMLEPSLTAFVGNSAVRPFFPSAMYLPAVNMLRPGWGRNDGIVPLASGRASMDLAYLDPVARLANVYEFGRDHGFMTSGCGDHFSGLCPSGDWTGDVYLDAVAERMLAYVPIGDGDGMRPRVNSIAAGVHHQLMILADGTLWASGQNGDGQLGIGTTEGPDVCSTAGDTYTFSCSRTPIPVPGMTGVVSVDAGWDHSVALRDDGTVWTWGWNAMGQLGDGTTTARSSPQRVQGLDDIVSVAAGSYTTMAVDGDGFLWIWGGNRHGELGVSPDEGPMDCGFSCSATPMRLDAPLDVVSVSAGDYHTLALTGDGTVWSWGFYLGSGREVTTSEPTPLSNPQHARWIDSSAGSYASAAIDEQGYAWVWGRLPCEDEYWVTPRRLDEFSGVEALAFPEVDSHCSVATGDGRLWRWGWIDGSGWTQTPVEVAELSDVVAMDAAYYRVIALTSGGGFYAWGEAIYGSYGMEEYSYTPVKIDISPLLVR